MFYKLNPDKTVEKMGNDQLDEWAALHEKTQRVARTFIGAKIVVSTVFLGVDHNFVPGSPILFETMVFGPFKLDFRTRHDTYEEAEHGHKLAVKFAIDELQPIVDAGATFTEDLTIKFAFHFVGEET